MAAQKKHGNAAKISKWDKKDIIEEAIKKRIAGVSYTKIKEHIEHHHGVSTRNAEYYIADVVKILKETYQEAITPEQIALQVAETVGRLELLYEATDKVHEKLAILKEISELKGLKKGKGTSSGSGTPAMIPIQIVINRNDSITSTSPRMIEIKNNSND